MKIFGRMFALLALVSTLGFAVGCGDDTVENKDAAQDQATDQAQDKGAATDATGN